METFYAKFRKLNANGYTLEAQEEKERLKQEWMKRYTKADPQPILTRPSSSWTAAISNEWPHYSGTNEFIPGDFVPPPPPPPPPRLPCQPLPNKTKAGKKTMNPIGVQSPRKSEFPEKMAILQAIVNGISKSANNDEDEVIYMGTNRSDYHPSPPVNSFHAVANKSDIKKRTSNENHVVLSKSDKRRAKKERKKARKLFAVTEPISQSKGDVEIDLNKEKTQQHFENLKIQFKPNPNIGIGVPCPIQPKRHLPFHPSPSTLSNIQHLDMDISDDEINEEKICFGMEKRKPEPILDISSYSSSISSTWSAVRQPTKDPRLGRTQSFINTGETQELPNTKVNLAEKRLEASTVQSDLKAQICSSPERTDEQQKHESALPLVSTDKSKVGLTQELATKKVQLLKAKARLLLAQKKQVELMNSPHHFPERGDSDIITLTEASKVSENVGLINDCQLKRQQTKDALPLPNLTAFSMPSLVIDNIGSTDPAEYINAPKRLKFMRNKTSDVVLDTVSYITNSNSADDEDISSHNVTEIENTITTTPQLDVWKKKSIDLKLKLAKRRLELKLLEKSKKEDNIDMNMNQKTIEKTNVASEWLNRSEEDIDRPSVVTETAEEYSQVLAPNASVAETLRTRQRELRKLIDVSKKNHMEQSRQAAVTSLTSMVDKQRELLLEHGEKIKEASAELKDCLTNLEQEKAFIRTCEARIDDLVSRKQILERMVLGQTQKLIDTRRLMGEYQGRNNAV